MKIMLLLAVLVAILFAEIKCPYDGSGGYFLRTQCDASGCYSIYKCNLYGHEFPVK